MKILKSCMMLLIVILLSANFTTAQDEKVSEISVELQTCRNIEERMPIDAADSFPSDIGQIYLWSKITGIEDSTVIKHLWSFRGEKKAEVELPVRSSSWRTWSSKKILPEWVGEWEVKVTDVDGNIFKSIKFNIIKAEPTDTVTQDTMPPAKPITGE